MTLPYVQTRWSLDDLFPSAAGPEIESTFSDVEAKVVEFEALRSQLSPEMPAETFRDLLKRLEEINRFVSRLYSYAGLWFASNTQDSAAQNFLARVNQFQANMQNRVLFFSLWWKSLEDAQAEPFIAASGPYHYWLEEMRLFKPYTLSEPEEKIINIKDVTGSRAINNLYDTLTNRYVFKLEVDGEVREMTRDELMVYARQHDPELRAKAYQELYQVYSKDNSILGQMYQTLVRDWRNEQIDLRHFRDPISARNLVNAIPDDVVDTLLEVCRSNADIFQRYFRLKAKWIGMERLRRYDVYAPVAKSEKHYEFEDAVGKVLGSFQAFNPEIAEMAKRVFAENHLDSEVRKGKRGGAFCWSVIPGQTPWVLLNYQGRSDDVAIMAHELGHAIHAMLAAEHTLFTFHATLPLAETASTFGEMMLVDRLLAEEEDEKVRRDMLFRQVDDAYATILRQAYFAMFERTAHELIDKGASIDDLAEAYLANLREQFGEAVEVTDEFRWEWISIPHIFHVPFYVYAYSFGQLLVLSLYKQYKAEGEAFKPRYLKILKAGSSESPERILTQAGIDIHRPEFWQGGFDILRELVEELEQIPVQKTQEN